MQRFYNPPGKDRQIVPFFVVGQNLRTFQSRF
eukprot:SAG11_NODE_32768_length_281_cov_0.571429_1_plen_31_part_10